MPRLVVPELLAWPARCRWPAWSITGTLPELLHLVPLQVCQAMRRPMACRCCPPVRSRRGRRQVLADLLAWPARCRRPAWLITGTLPQPLHPVLLQACQVMRWQVACRWWPPARSRRGRRQVLADLLA